MSVMELFPKSVGAMDSPRIAWMKKHGIELVMRLNDPKVPNHRVCVAKVANGNGQHEPMFYGATPDEALHGLAEAYGWALWNEEEVAS